MADRKLLLLNGLRRALAEPSGLPLYAGKSAAGLFPSTQPGKQAAQRCLDDGLLRQNPTDPQLYSLSETGLDWLLQQTSPREVLDDMVRALEARQAETSALVETARRINQAITPPEPDIASSSVAASMINSCSIMCSVKLRSSAAARDPPPTHGWASCLSTTSGSWHP